EHAGGRPGGRRDPALDGAAEALAARRTSQGALGALRRTLLAGPRGAPLSAVARCAGTARPRAPLCPLRAGPAVAAGAGACPAGHRARCLRVPGPGGAVGPRGACARRRPR
ncbi:unnamed protein product, partial [Prorocentrum cordatum]